MTCEPSALRYAVSFSAGSGALAVTRVAPGRMKRPYAASAQSRLDTWYASPSSWISPRVAPVEAPNQ
jgi:hypothetical protein